MYRGATVAVVVPAYNEADHVGGVVETVPGFVDRVYAVDDASTDDTWEVLSARADVVLEGGRDDPSWPDGQATRWPSPGEGSGPSREASERRSADGGSDPRPAYGDGGPDSTAGDEGPGSTGAEGAPGSAPASGDAPDDGPPVVAVRHRENRGVGGAIKTGYRLALADDVDVTAVMAADGQMDPDYLDDIVAPVAEGRADYAKGTRLSRPDHVTSMSRWRRFGNWLLTHLTRISTGCWDVEDPQDGYTAISRRALSRIRIDDLYDRYGFANDLLAALSRRGMRVVDVPHPAKYGDEGSEIRYRTFVPGLSWLLLSNFLRRLGRTAASDPFDPAVVGYLLGGTGLAAAAVGVPLAVVGAAGGPHTVSAGTVAVAFALGVTCTAAALVADARQGSRSPAPSRQSTDVGEGGRGL